MKFKLGDRVRKIKGSSWQGIVVGTYATELTPEGYAVESEREKGSVQIYPAQALELVDDTSMTHHSENTECCEKCKIFEGLDGFPNCKSSSCPCHHPKEDWEKEICKILLKYDTTEKELVNVRKQYVDELLGYIRTHFTHTATLRWKIEEKRREISYEGAPKTLNAENQNYRKIGYTEALDDIVALLKE